MPLTLQHIKPSIGTPGESFDIVLDGAGFQNGAVVSLGPGITVDANVFRSDQQLSATITIAEAAAFGPRDLTVTNPDAGTAIAASHFFVLDRSEKDRKAFLLAMYTQMWKNIDTHILVVWQSVAAVLNNSTHNRQSSRSHA